MSAPSRPNTPYPSLHHAAADVSEPVAAHGVVSAAAGTPEPLHVEAAEGDRLSRDDSAVSPSRTAGVLQLGQMHVTMRDPTVRGQGMRGREMSEQSDDSKHSYDSSTGVVFNPTAVLALTRQEELRRAMDREQAEFRRRVERERQELEEKQHKLRAELELLDRQAAIETAVRKAESAINQGPINPQAAAEVEATGSGTGVKKESATAAARQSGARVGPHIIWPEPDQQRTEPTASANVAGVDLTQLMIALQGQTLKAHATAPPRFAGQPLNGRPPIHGSSSGAYGSSSGSAGSNASEGRNQTTALTFKQWINQMELYFTVCGMKEEKMQFAYAMTMLTGAAQIHIARLVKKGGTSSSGALPTTWSWLKDKMKETYQPEAREDLMRQQLSLVRQRKEPITDYYNLFQWYASQITLSAREEFDYFERGLKQEYRDMLRETQWTRRSTFSTMGKLLNLAPSADVGTLTVEEAVELCLAKEEGDALKEENRRREHQLHGHSFSNSSNTYSGGHRSGYRGTNGYRGNSSQSSSSNSRPYQSVGNSRSNPIQLSHLESRQEGEQGGSDTEGFDEQGMESEGPGYELNAVEGSPSMMVRSNPPRDSDQSNGRGLQGVTVEIRCWNCDRPGHLKRDCKLPSKPRAASKGTGSSGSKDRNSRGTGKA
jgi:hypothetical protein